MIKDMNNECLYEYTTTSADMTKRLAALLAPHLRAGDVVVLSGGLGAGKTQFVQGVAAGLGVRERPTSPTFNILLAYSAPRLFLYHFDLYRLDSQEQLEDIAYYETLEGDGVSFIEWGEKFPGALGDDYATISIDIDNQANRCLRMYAQGSRAHELLCLWAHDIQLHHKDFVR